MKRKQKLGSLQQFLVKDRDGRAVRDDQGRWARIAAFTAKSAKHQAKQVYGDRVVVERT
jgi:hypothetical protein